MSEKINSGATHVVDMILWLIQVLYLHRISWLAEDYLGIKDSVSYHEVRRWSHTHSTKAMKASSGVGIFTARWLDTQKRQRKTLTPCLIVVLISSESLRFFGVSFSGAGSLTSLLEDSRPSRRLPGLLPNHSL